MTTTEVSTEQVLITRDKNVFEYFKNVCQMNDLVIVTSKSECLWTRAFEGFF